MLEKKIFHASALAALAKNVAGTENLGDGTHDGDNLLWLDEGVEANGEMRLRGEAASDADGKAELVSRSE
jgi:hypothetical protein